MQAVQRHIGHEASNTYCTCETLREIHKKHKPQQTTHASTVVRETRDKFTDRLTLTRWQQQKGSGF